MITRQFITAGKAVFTVQSVSGQYFTFKVTHKEGNVQWPPVWFVSLLTGPDNTSDFTYMGMLEAEIGTVRLTKASKYNDDTLPVKVLRWALTVVWSGKDLPAGYQIHHEGRCCRCGRVLTVPESIESGIGPECAKMMSMA